MTPPISIMPRVAVLMSTYNGERFVGEQLKSILEQLPPNGAVMVRDDGSTDGTLSAIAALGDTRISVQEGSNLGFGPSFLSLLGDVSRGVDMVMFADQDDVWLPGKIDRAWQRLSAAGTEPTLYGSAVTLVDEWLSPIGETIRWGATTSFKSALVQNVVTGCTSALNAPALALLQRAGAHPSVHFHDWWAFLVVSAFGRVVLDPEPTVLYRQHEANQIGRNVHFLRRAWSRVRFLWRRDWVGIMLGQITALMEVYGADLPRSHRNLVTNHFSASPHGYKPRWRFVLSPHKWRQTTSGELAMRLLIAAYKLRLWPLPHRRLALQAVSPSANDPVSPRQPPAAP
jgi:glycosyltransferase involved in cell wall biosynthesis